MQKGKVRVVEDMTDEQSGRKSERVITTKSPCEGQRRFTWESGVGGKKNPSLKVKKKRGKILYSVKRLKGGKKQKVTDRGNQATKPLSRGGNSPRGGGRRLRAPGKKEKRGIRTHVCPESR